MAVERLAKIASGESPNDLGVTIELLCTPKPILLLRKLTDGSFTWIDELRDFISLDILPEDKNKGRQICKVRHGIQ